MVPFGWAVICNGKRPDQVTRSADELAQWSSDACARHFPPERGYQISTETPAGETPGVNVIVHRGDFRAEVTIEHDPDTPSRALVAAPIRAFGNARSELLHAAHRHAEGLVNRWRNVGAALGLSMFFSLAWLMIGVNNPVYVLGGMLLVVALLLTLMAGGTLGTWFGEELARRHRGRARALVQRDIALSHDMRRWKALTRQLTAQRSALTSKRGQPFRTAPRELAS